MERIADLRASRVAVYPTPVIPIARLLAGSLGKQLMETLGFGVARAEGGEVHLGQGSISIDGEEIIILNLQMNDRRVMLTVEGTSAQADAVAQAIKMMVAPEDAWPAPKVVVYETACTARLNFGWQQLVSGGLRDFVEDSLKPSAGSMGETPEITRVDVVMNLKYATPKSLAEYDISLSPKPFIVGVAPQTPPDDRIFRTQSPTTSDEHLRLLGALEAALADKQEAA